MRTITFVGLLIIGGALRSIAEMQEIRHEKFFVIILICCIFMDIAEFINKMTNE